MTASDRAWVCRVAALDPAALRRLVGADDDPAAAMRLQELERLLRRALQLLQPDFLPRWLRTPLPGLGERTPLELLADGEQGALRRLLAGLEDPGAS